MYTQTFPDGWSWLSEAAGRYFVLAATAVNGSGISSVIRRQKHHADPPNGRLSAYAQAATSDQQFTVAGGFAAPTI